jgi:hypothetical protein
MCLRAIFIPNFACPASAVSYRHQKDSSRRFSHGHHFVMYYSGVNNHSGSSAILLLLTKKFTFAGVFVSFSVTVFIEGFVKFGRLAEMAGCGRGS